MSPTKTKGRTAVVKKAATTKASSKKPAKAAAPAKTKSAAKAKGMSFAEAMAALEAAGTAQNRKVYARHGAREPMFGVSFAVMKELTKRAGTDHALAKQLWATKNSDARTLAVRVADPAKLTSAELDRWTNEVSFHLLVDSIAMLASETPYAREKAEEWLAVEDDRRGRAAWTLVGQLALRDPTVPDAWFLRRLGDLEKKIHSAPNLQREGMNRALISIGGRNAALREAAFATAKRIGTVHVDHGETSCKTPDAKAYIVKMWAHAESKGFPTPAEQEMKRERPRHRC